MCQKLNIVFFLTLTKITKVDEKTDGMEPYIINTKTKLSQKYRSTITLY